MTPFRGHRGKNLDGATFLLEEHFEAYIPPRTVGGEAEELSEI